MSTLTLTRTQRYGHDCLTCGEPLDPFSAVAVPGIGLDLYAHADCLHANGAPTACDWCGQRDTDPIKPNDED